MRCYALAVNIIGCAAFLLWLSPLRAQEAAAPCTVSASSPSSFTPLAYNSFGSMPTTIGSAAASSFTVSCPGTDARNGTLRLSIDSRNTYNGTPLLRVFSTDGGFGSTSTGYVDAVNLSFAANSSTRSGNVYYLIQIAAPSGQVLRAERNYGVTIRATLN
jgi:hypothetical protein